MSTGKLFRHLSKFLIVAVGASLLLVPAAVDARSVDPVGLITAVPAPSPLVQSATPWDDYDKWNSLLSNYRLTAEQRHNLISRMDSDLESRLQAGSVEQTELEYRALLSYQPHHARRYQDYARKNPTLSVAQVVSNVNMELDLTFYDHPLTVTQPDSTTVLVNKHFALSPEYAPEVEALGSLYGTGMLRSEAAQAFRAMADAARADGLTLRSVSAYRSYRTQEVLYNYYLNQNSQDVVDDYSARPGHSEHQTGLALDINVARTSAHFENTVEYAWLLEHCAEFGFILRYPQEKEHITGYRFEPWHYRYVGTEIAAYCMEHDLTYEEYVAALPADGTETLPSISYQGRFLTPDQPPVVLNGNLYLPAESFARELGWTASEMTGSTALSLYQDSTRLTLVPGIRYQNGARVLPLSSAALKLDKYLYLTLEDLCSVLDLKVHSTDFGLELTNTPRH